MGLEEFPGSHRSRVGVIVVGQNVGGGEEGFRAKLLDLVASNIRVLVAIEWCKRVHVRGWHRWRRVGLRSTCGGRSGDRKEVIGSGGRRPCTRGYGGGNSAVGRYACGRMFPG